MLEHPSTLYAGVDECGRGCLFGPVVAAAVVLPQSFPDDTYQQIKDSKKLSEKKRNLLASYIKEHALAYSIASLSHTEIDKYNILQASLKAMHKALNTIYPTIPFTSIYVDGNHFKPFLPPNTDQEAIPHYTLEQGDNKILAIAAASILAKTYRDNLILEGCQENELWNRYDLHHNKGYGTPKHLKALREYGPIEGHRLTFSPVSQAVLEGQ